MKRLLPLSGQSLRARPVLWALFLVTLRLVPELVAFVTARGLGLCVGGASQTVASAATVFLSRLLEEASAWPAAGLSSVHHLEAQILKALEPQAAVLAQPPLAGAALPPLPAASVWAPWQAWAAWLGGVQTATCLCVAVRVLRT